MFKKRIVWLFAALVALLLLTSASMAAAGALENRTVAVVAGRSQMSVPLSEFGFDLDGSADMEELVYNARLKADGSVRGTTFTRSRSWVRQRPTAGACTV